MKKNPKCVVAGQKASVVRWAKRHELIDELRAKFGDNKDQMDKFQFQWKTEQMVLLLQVMKSVNR